MVILDKRKATENSDGPVKKGKFDGPKKNFEKNGKAPGQRLSTKPSFDGKKFKPKEFKKPFDQSKYKAGKTNGKLYSKTDGKPLKTTYTKADSKAATGKPEVPLKKKELKKERRQKKLAGDYEVHANMKKIWETLRRSDTTDEAKKKLCTSLYDNVTGKISQMAFAHDTCRVIECLVQYGNERHRTGVFNELKDNLVELSKSKYARFMIKKLLLYCDKDQKEFVIKAFMGKVVKLIKHSFACQVIETIYNEHANYAQRIQMQMEFYDSSLTIFTDHKMKTLKDVIDAQPVNKEKYLTNVKKILSSCITKTLLMFSLVHKIFAEYFLNCEAKEKLEMIDTLGDQLIHMVHTKDGTEVALQCIWFGTAKERKKIVKAMKTFIYKISIEEHGHKVLLGIFDSVDDTKFISKSILEELFRSGKELFDNEYSRKVITYLIAPRDTRFFIKDYVKRLETGDGSETKKKDPEIRKKELLDYSKPFLKEFLNKEISSLIFNGAGGVLIPVALKVLEKDSDPLVEAIANVLLEKRFEPSQEMPKDKKETVQVEKPHAIEDATVHYICKQILSGDAEREKNSSKTLGDALLSHENSMFLRYWIECNRGCFTLVQLIESCNDVNKNKIKIILEGSGKELAAAKASGAKILVKKLDEIK